MEQLLGIVGFEDRGNFVLGEPYEYLNIVSTTDGCYFAKKENRNVPLTDEDTWKQFSRLGVDGKNIELGINSTHLQWRLEGDTNWTDLIALSSLKGADGKELEIRTDNGYIQTKLTGENWSDLIELESLKGSKGDRGLQGKPLVVLNNGHYGYWDEQSEDYVDSGVEASATVDIENAAVNFMESAIRENIQAGEKVPVIFGKLKKWFNDLGALAWKSKVDYDTDIDNLPSIPELQIQSDWDQADNSKKDFILNKPSIPVSTSDLTNDSDFQTSSQTGTQISNHNTSDTAHNDIREALTNLANTTLFEHVAQLPESGEVNKIYIIPYPESEDEENKYLEYYWNASENKWEMLGGAGGGSQSGGVTNPNYEIVTISPQSNHVNIEHEFIGNVQIEVMWDETVQRQWTFDGSPMTLFVPKDKEYTVKVSELDWFNTPEPLVYTAEGGNTRTASPTYTCAEINVSFWDYGRQLSTEFFYLMDGAVLTVSLNGKEKEVYFQGYNNPSTLYAPIGSELTFTGTETLSDLFVPVPRTLKVTDDKMGFVYQYESGGLSISAHASNNDSFTYTFSVCDAATNEILFADIECTSQRSKFIPIRVGRRVIIRFGKAEGFRKPEDLQIAVPKGSEYVSGYYRGTYLQIRKNLMKEVVAIVYNNTDNTVYNTVTIPAEYSSNQNMSVRMENGLNYRVEFSDVIGYETPSPITGTIVEEYTTVTGSYKGSIFRLHNNNNTTIHAKLYNTDTDEVYFDSDISQWNTTEVVIPVGVPYNLTAKYGDENILEESGVSESGSKQVTMQKPTYYLNLRNQYKFDIVYILTNLVTNISTEHNMSANSSINVELPIGINYKVELLPYEDFGLPEPYIGIAEMPAGSTSYSYTLTLSYEASNLQISSYMNYVDAQPERTFTIINRDTNEVYDTVLMPLGNTSTSVLLPFNFNFEIRASDVKGFSSPSPYTGNTGTQTNMNISMQYAYFVIYGMNYNNFNINAQVIDVDTNVVLHDFVIGSYNNSYSYSIKPGTNYMIQFSDVEGYQKPSSITGTATINGQRYLNQSDTTYTAV